ncbi:MAG: GAF domain-containing protein, partial [Chloroflexi bacterium]
ANAIANARLFEQMHQAQQIAEQRLYETQALQELSKKLASTLEMDQILDTFFQACTDIVGFEYVIVSLVEKEHNRVRAVAGRGVSEQNIQRANRALDSTDIMADIIRTGSTEVITGWDDRFDRETFEAEGHADWVRVFTPIVLQNENIGLVEAGYNISTKTEITPAQLDLLRAFIDQMALALDNARRYQAIQRAARREAIITEIAGKIRSSISVEDILKTTVEELGKVTGASRGHILLTINQPPVSTEPPRSDGPNGSGSASR